MSCGGAEEAYSLQGVFSNAYLHSWQELAVSVQLETLTFGKLCSNAN